MPLEYLYWGEGVFKHQIKDMWKAVLNKKKMGTIPYYHAVSLNKTAYP
jgi:hypothetical protein